MKKYAAKMAKFSKIPEKFDKQNFEKKMLFAAKKLRFCKSFKSKMELKIAHRTTAYFYERV